MQSRLLASHWRLESPEITDEIDRWLVIGENKGEVILKKLSWGVLKEEKSLFIRIMTKF
jgi:hypothetical protein